MNSLNQTLSAAVIAAFLAASQAAFARPIGESQSEAAPPARSSQEMRAS